MCKIAKYCKKCFGLYSILIFSTEGIRLTHAKDANWIPTISQNVSRTRLYFNLTSKHSTRSTNFVNYHVCLSMRMFNIYNGSKLLPSDGIVIEDFAGQKRLQVQTIYEVTTFCLVMYYNL